MAIIMAMVMILIIVILINIIIIIMMMIMMMMMMIMIKKTDNGDSNYAESPVKPILGVALFVEIYTSYNVSLYQLEGRVLALLSAKCF